jgi:hypothetical protein
MCAVQYTHYTEFNGALTNHDGAGRNTAVQNSKGLDRSLELYCERLRSPGLDLL